MAPGNVSGKKRTWRISLAISVVWSCVALQIVGFFPRPFELLDYKIYDLKLSLLADSSSSPTIIHVDVDDKAIRKLGPWPWDRALSARIVQRLAELGAKAIVLDILYSTEGKSAEGDDKLAKSIEDSGNAVVAVSPISIAQQGKLRYDSESKPRADLLYDRSWALAEPKGLELLHVEELRSSGLPLPHIMQSSKFLGHIKATRDRDGVFRRVPLFLELADRVLPSLSLGALAAYLQVGPEHIQLSDRGSIEINPGTARLTIPVDSHANLLIHWCPTWDRFHHYSVLDLLTDEPDASRERRYKDKIAIVALTWTGSTDIGVNPLESEFPLSRMHSAVLDTVLTGRFLYPVAAFPLVALCGVLVSVLFGVSPAKLSLRRQIALFFAIMALAVAVVTVGFFTFSREIPAAEFLFIFVPSAVLLITFRSYSNERERELVRNTFGRHVTDEVVEELLNCGTGINVQGDLKEATFLISDLRGFTAMTESLPPMVSVDIVNRYLEKMTEVIVRHQGTINEFLGDGILVFFGVPRGDPDHPRKAVACALDMQVALEALNCDQRRMGLPELTMGIGINTGIAVVGTIGSERRRKYTAMGSAINVAFRVEGQSKGREVLVTRSVYQRLERDLEISSVRQAQLKGIAEPTTLYCVAGLKARSGSDPQ